MLLGALSAAFIALVVNDFSKKKSSSPIDPSNTFGGLSLDVKNAFASSPFAYYPDGDAHENILDAGIPQYPKYQGNPTLRDPYSYLLVQEPNAKESELINKSDVRNWQIISGLPGTKFFDGRRNMDLHMSKIELDDWCIQTQYFNPFTPYYQDFNGRTLNPQPKMNAGFLLGS